MEVPDSSTHTWLHERRRDEVVVVDLLTMPVMRARGLVSCLWAKKALHLERSLLTVTSVAMSCLALMVKSVGHAPCTVA